ncbi:MAG: M15 family metallopeptidase, partial [Gammaproteobacteria bacterium]
MKNIYLILMIFIFCLCYPSLLIANSNHLPPGFVYLKDIDATIVQDIRYSTYHNFIGRPIKGYETGECILTKPAALALANTQKELQHAALSLKVYDCYRPQMAVDDFIAWSQQPNAQQMKAEFYPRVNKVDFFKLGYVAAKSSHTRGSTVDLTLVPISNLAQEQYHPGQKLIACFVPYLKRFHDGSIDMGTGFDCMDELSHNDNNAINLVAYHHRLLLKKLMEKYGFVPYQP